MSTQKHELIEVLGKQNLMNTTEFWDVLKSSVVPKEFSDSQTMVFLSVAHSLNLNPLNGEVYPAIMDGRVCSLVGIDGWIKRANAHPQMDGMDVALASDGSECTVTIHRKDRAHPTVITEYFSECVKSTRPWKSHPKRMLRHRAIIQAIRVAFGAEGAVDEDDRNYFPADATVIETPTADVGDRITDLNKTIGEAVGEPEPPKFVTIERTSCNEPDCRKRLVRYCEACGRHFCEAHYDSEADMCIGCFVKQGDESGPSDEEPASVDESDQTPVAVENLAGEKKEVSQKYPQNKGADPMPNREAPAADGGNTELPWE